MENKKSIGLPGGPNEFLKEITQHISVEGYKRYSEDVNNPYNIIPSGDITMKGVDFPVIGTDNLGNTKAMIPGNDYKFPGDVVFETPMYKRGGGLLTKTMKCNNCSWSWKAADGGNDVSTCHKCGGEALPKAQTGFEAPKRVGVRKNSDGRESTHLMATETLDGKNWFSFPTLFQDPDGTWIDMSEQAKKDWKPVYEEAKKRGEVIDFGTDKEAAIKFGQGSWKPKMQTGGEYKVKSGDTFYGIVNKNNISKEDLIKANPGIDIQNLKLNQTIKFPVQDNVQDNVQKPEETSWSDYLNPMNWGVSDRDDDGDFKQAFRAAREAGEDEFMWYGTRYTTDLKSTPKQAPGKPVEEVKEEQPFNITPQLLYKQAYVESRLDPKAKNSLGYMGLGQIGKGVITDYKKATGVKEVDPFDPKQNHDVQEWSMNELYNASFIDKPGATAENKLIKALASYNYGRGKVRKILEAEKAKGNDIYKSNDWTKQLPKETREYIDMIVYDGVTEKRPDVQTNFKKATEEDEYKDLRELYKYQSGGEIDNLTIYKNYINGVYDNTPEENQAQKVYDKLNRLHYRDAKAKQMTPANYVLTYITG